MNSTGSRLKDARKYLRLTQSQLAKKLEMEWYQIRDMESGKVEVSTLFARLFCLEFGVHDYWLLRGEGEMIPAKRDRVAEPAAEYRDDVTRKILTMLEGMDVETRRDVLKYTEEKQLVAECRREKKLKEG